MYDKDKVLVSFSPNKGRIVLLLSSFHSRGIVDKETNKPEIVLFYNETKGGVDTFDKLCHSKTVARKTRRWPLRVFYGMVDGAGINAHIIFKENRERSNSNVPTKPRREYLKNLALELVKPLIRRRLQSVPNLPRELRYVMTNVLGENEPIMAENVQPERQTRKRCSICPSSKDRKGKDKCVVCKNALCAEHRHAICQHCIMDVMK